MWSRWRSELEAEITAALDVSKPGELEALFDTIQKKWGRLDLLVHSIAFAPKADLQGGLLELLGGGLCDRDGYFLSFLRAHGEARSALMTDGGVMFAMSYLGANKVVPNYNVMGPVKAALEAVCRYLAYELGTERRARACDFSRAFEDARRLRPEGFRAAAERGGA